ncbi:MAG: TerB family tellurite resistance protein [Deltaproteobacteria bacterium]|nr:TerB family tellurite resistance protein [Deltaproteobacteria bacterium]
MREIELSHVKPLIEKAEQNGSTMVCVFKCPASGARIEASASIQKGRDLGGIAKASATRSLMWSLRSSVQSAVRSVLGYGILGRVGGDVAHQLLSDASKKADESYSEGEKSAAIVEAFRSVSSRFIWDTKNARYISTASAGDVLSEFQQQLESAPITQKYDRGVLARMLIEIASADGTIAPEERAFLTSFLTPEMGTLDALAQKPRLTTAELSETSPSSRKTMLMLAWALALTDEELADEERKRLSELAEGLGLGHDQAQTAMEWAQIYLVDQALEAAYAQGATESAKKTVMDLSARIHLDPTKAERAEIRYRKRSGLI